MKEGPQKRKTGMQEVVEKGKRMITWADSSGKPRAMWATTCSIEEGEAGGGRNMTTGTLPPSRPKPYLANKSPTHCQAGSTLGKRANRDNNVLYFFSRGKHMISISTAGWTSQQTYRRKHNCCTYVWRCRRRTYRRSSGVLCVLGVFRS